MTRINSRKFPARLLGIGALTMMVLASPGQAQIKVLVFKGFFGYNHSARNTATTAMKSTLPTLLGSTPAFTVDETESPTELTPTNLANYQVLVLNNNTGIGGLTTAQRNAVTSFSQTKGIVAIHSTADFKGGASWPDMVSFIGGSLDGHTARMGKLRTELPSHPINAGLAAEAWINDEWYGYSTNPRNAAGTTILTNIDEASMGSLTDKDGRMGDHPISWCKELPTGGRMFYTAAGHRDSVMQRNPFARRQLYNAILWVAKSTPTRVTPAPSGSAESADGVRAGAERGALRVTFQEGGEHAFTVATPDGRRVASRKGAGVLTHDVTGLRPGSVYVVSGKSRAGTFSKLVSIP
jgi:type 1 glutamine amidotransferase